MRGLQVPWFLTVFVVRDCVAIYIRYSGCKGDASLQATHRLVENSPFRCFKACGVNTDMVALHESSCFCGKQSDISALLSVVHYGTPEMTCTGDPDLLCGCNDVRHKMDGWSVYEQMGDQLWQTELSDGKKTGCMAATNIGNDPDLVIVPCNMALPFLCQQTLNEQCVLGKANRWSEGCLDEGIGFLPAYSSLSSCRLREPRGLYWTGILQINISEAILDDSSTPDTLSTETGSSDSNLSTSETLTTTMFDSSTTQSSSSAHTTYSLETGVTLTPATSAPDIMTPSTSVYPPPSYTTLCILHPCLFTPTQKRSTLDTSIASRALPVTSSPQTRVLQTTSTQVFIYELKSSYPGKRPSHRLTTQRDRDSVMKTLHGIVKDRVGKVMAVSPTVTPLASTTELSSQNTPYTEARTYSLNEDIKRYVIVASAVVITVVATVTGAVFCIAIRTQRKLFKKLRTSNNEHVSESGRDSHVCYSTNDVDSQDDIDYSLFSVPRPSVSLPVRQSARETYADPSAEPSFTSAVRHNPTYYRAGQLDLQTGSPPSHQMYPSMHHDNSRNNRLNVSNDITRQIQGTSHKVDYVSRAPRAPTENTQNGDRPSWINLINHRKSLAQSNVYTSVFESPRISCN